MRWTVIFNKTIESDTDSIESSDQQRWLQESIARYIF